MTEDEILAQAKQNKAPTEEVVNELDVLFETSKSYTVNGEQLTIRPFSFGELPRVIALLKGVGSQFAFHKAQNSLNSAEGIMDIIASGGENLIQALSLNTGKPRAFFDTVSPEDGVKIMQDFLMMNIGFFTQRVLPVIKGMK